MGLNTFVKQILKSKKVKNKKIKIKDLDELIKVNIL